MIDILTGNEMSVLKGKTAMNSEFAGGTASRIITIMALVLAAATPGIYGEETGNVTEGGTVKILFLHHSTGENIWNGGVPECFETYNRENGTDYQIDKMIFPKESPYGWNNYPFDYWNIWVNHGGDGPFMEEPSLEMLTADYDVIILKHCFPVSDILDDTGSPSVTSDEKRLENYKMQYDALKVKMHLFPDTKFIVWTAAPRVEVTSWRAKLSALLKRNSEQKANAERAKAFVEWVRSEWDEPGDNIFVWDFFELGTEGGIFLKKEYAEAPGNSHPGKEYSKTVAPYLCRRVIDVVEGRGDVTDITGR